MATDMTASGSPEEKLRWAFKMYDKDGSGQSIVHSNNKPKTKEQVLSLCLTVLSIVVACNNK